MKYILILFFVSASYGHTVLIDPGHGGSELGATIEIPYKASKMLIKEKDLALKIGKKIKKLLSKSHSVYLTRSIDRDLTLQERADIADKIKADLFISLHFNSNPIKKYRGFEVYYLDNHQDQAVKKVESVENAGLSGEDLIVNQILIDLVIDKTSADSKKLATQIHKAISKNIQKSYRMRNRGVKPGLFYVLALSKRPSALIEVGFLSNPDEAKKMNSEKFLNDYALAISNGINQYLKSVAPKPLPLF